VLKEMFRPEMYDASGHLTLFQKEKCYDLYGSSSIVIIRRNGIILWATQLCPMDKIRLCRLHNVGEDA
jgi:hypothetical protein